MGDEAAGVVEHERVARLTDMDRRDHIPDQLEIDHRDGDAVDLARAGDGHRHMRLGALVQCHRAEPDLAGTGTHHSGIVGTIDTAVDDVGVYPRDMQPFDTLAVDECDIDDGRYLPHQSQYIEAVALVGAFPPRQLHGPL